MAFKFLPKVKRCCFCVNLKNGSILIGIICIIIIGGQAVADVSKSELVSVCRNPKKLGGVVVNVLSVIENMRYGVAFLLFLAATVLLVGIILQRPKACHFFVIVGLLVFVLEIFIYTCSFFISMLHVDECGVGSVYRAALKVIIVPLIIFYFVVVVNSFESGLVPQAF